MCLVVWSGREEQRVGRADRAVPEPQGPQAVDLDRPIVLTPQLTAVMARSGIVCMDTAAAEVADQKVAADLAEGCRRNGHSPRRIELVGVVEPAEQVAARVEYVDETVAAAGHVILGIGVLLGI